ncbi:MAG TPA: MFS transporter [Candidatus Sulfotelmatobacter sp.]|nr:MFS transporter [Candidatus Sulfotelmatobacter sp.]
MICALLFFAATVNYMDRQVIALLKPTLQVQFGWTDVDYSNIVLIFQFADGAGVLFVGKLIDRAGTRKRFSLAVLERRGHGSRGRGFHLSIRGSAFFLGPWRSWQFPGIGQGCGRMFP